ncbi:Adhesion G protein-coupled receptor A1 [Oryzias melastigma]|uniref:Adhesion G protein-coupled receptor A1 n=1 Tax=Oryzias melastigma TaxID=30732 RepID=A0A834BMR7_ORYME|nr:Adhesion G protein-coupled receptor A1 [Oryzias melastigma]
MASLSMDGSMHSPHLDSPHSAHHLQGFPLVSNSPHPDLQLPCPSPHLDKQLASCHNLQRQTSCLSVQDSVASCHSHAHNMHDNASSSLLIPSQGVHSCQWHLYSSADPSPNPSCCDKADPFNAQFSADEDTACGNTLPRQHATVSRRGTIGRNRSLQEDGLFGADATGNIRTGPWKNETTV